MSEKKLIGIALIPEKAFDVDISELPVVKSYRFGEARYRFPDRLYIDMALEELLKAELPTRPSMAFLVLEIRSGEEPPPEPEIKARRRRRRRPSGGAL